MARTLSIPRLPSGRAGRVAAAGIIVVLLAASTVVVVILERSLLLPDASAAYLPAVVIVAAVLGTWPAIAASVLAFLTYDFLFVEPVYTFTVAAPTEWLALLLFLLVAVVVGRLTALLAQREREASQRAREARVLFAISLDLATAPTVADAIGRVVDRLRGETRMTRVWCGLGPNGADERIVADTAPREARPPLNARFVLRRDAAGGPAGWVRVRDPVAAGRPSAEDVAVFRVALESSGEVLGSIWAVRPRRLEPPSGESTRFLLAAADQIAQAVHRDQLVLDATNAEVARQSDALKSALLDSVSHDLRTPLSAIRAAAGHLVDPDVEPSLDETRAVARVIETEARRLDRLVGNILDLSRIEGGALRPGVAPYELADLVELVIERLSPLLAGARLEVSMPPDLPPVLVDALFVDQILTNLVENAATHAGPDRPIRVSASAVGEEEVRLVVEDGGRGVPPSALPHLFDKFYRVSRRGEAARPGMGIGLAVVRGLVEAMGGRVEARRSELGGLAVAVSLPVAAMPPSIAEARLPGDPEYTPPPDRSTPDGTGR